MDHPGVSRWIRVGVVAAVLTAVLAWAYWPALGSMANRWAYDPRYAHGYLVPLFSLALLWIRRDCLRGSSWRGTAWGLLPLVLALGAYLAGSRIANDWLVGVSLPVALSGMALLAGGWTAFRWAWPALAFLGFMVPLPFRLELALGWPLQRIATIAGAYLLQTLGVAAIGEGNVIQLATTRLGVVEACSGLSMMLLFLALATGVAMLSRRPLIDRLVLVASAIPIAVISNITRIVVTGVLHETVGPRFADAVYHDLAGWLMMPLALGLLAAELWVLKHLFVEVEATDDRRRGWRAAVGAAPLDRTKPPPPPGRGGRRSGSLIVP